jgi:hypothetical protein
MSQMSSANAERALENRAHVRMLLRLHQPAFAAALASAEQDFFTDRRGVARQTCSAAAAWPGLRRPAHQRDHGPALPELPAGADNRGLHDWMPAP